VSDHSYDDDAAMTVVRLAEELVGEDAYGGAWIDRTLAQPVLGIALIAPQADHVTSIREAARRAGWSITIDLVKYSSSARGAGPSASRRSRSRRSSSSGLISVEGYARRPSQ
jgi:hypothetical protein